MRSTAVNILIVNLTRFGDILQMQAAITDLAGQGKSIGVVCLDNFIGAVALLRGVSYVAGLPGAGFLADLQSTSTLAKDDERLELPTVPPFAWAKAPLRLFQWRQELERQFLPDLICNLTPSLSARILARFLARDKEIAGFGLDPHGFGYNSSPWATFLLGAAGARGMSPFNVVDLFRMAALGQSGQILPGDATVQLPEQSLREIMREKMSVLAPAACTGFAGLQMGASEERRRWPVASFAAAGDALWQEKGICPVLFGSKGERHLVERYATLAKHPYISLCGETNVEELAAALSLCKCLITNDTGTMHLAAGINIPVVSIFLATAQPFDTGPYQAGSYCLEPGMPCHPCSFGTTCPREHQCRYAVSSETVSAIALHLTENSAEKFVLASKNSSAALQKQGLASPNALPIGRERVWHCIHDAAGFMSLESASGHDNEDRTLWFRVQRHILRQFLDRPRASAFSPSLTSLPCAFSEATRTAITTDLREAIAQVTLLQQQGKVLAMRSLPAMRDQFLASWNKVHACLRHSPRLAALAMLWVEETQAEGQDFPVTLAVIGQFLALMQAFEDQINS